MPRIGVLRSFVDPHHEALLDELRTQGWAPGTAVEVHPADHHDVVDDVAEARAQLAAWGQEAPLDLIVAFSTPFAEVAAVELPDVPVLSVVNDPVTSGLVEDRRRPEGQLTGVTFRTPADRTLALAQRGIGALDRIAYVFPAEDQEAVAAHLDDIEQAAAAVGVAIEAFPYDGPADVAGMTDRVAAAGVDAVWVANSNGTVRDVDVLGEALAASSLPAIANNEHLSFALVIVAPDGAELRRQLARQAARLLAGTAVSSVPVEDPRRFVVVINTTGLAALRLPEADPALLRQADVIR